MKSSWTFLLCGAILASAGCVKTEAPPPETKAAKEVAPKEKNIMRFKDNPKPPASKHAGEL